MREVIRLFSLWNYALHRRRKANLWASNKVWYFEVKYLKKSRNEQPHILLENIVFQKYNVVDRVIWLSYVPPKITVKMNRKSFYLSLPPIFSGEFFALLGKRSRKKKTVLRMFYTFLCPLFLKQISLIETINICLIRLRDLANLLWRANLPHGG